MRGTSGARPARSETVLQKPQAALLSTRAACLNNSFDQTGIPTIVFDPMSLPLDSYRVTLAQPEAQPDGARPDLSSPCTCWRRAS